MANIPNSVQVISSLRPNIFKPIGSNRCGWNINTIKRCPEYKGDGKDIGSYFAEILILLSCLLIIRLLI